MPKQAQAEQASDVFERLSLEYLKENRSKRRWGIAFKLFIALYLILLLVLALNSKQGHSLANPRSAHTALIDIKGLIADTGDTNADQIATALSAAFENEHVQGIILRINSPGGSPVQAGQIYDEIRRQKAKHPDIKVYAVATDICASAAYYIAAAADEIYADKASIVGSIGVIINSFGLVDTMKKFGAERRLYTAGEYKAMLDPFTPEKAEEKEIIYGLLNTIHQQFINSVKAGRGDRLSTSEDIFNGRIWVGEQAIKLGLIDGLASPGYVAREIIGETNIVNYTPHKKPWEKIIEDLGTTLKNQLITLWQPSLL